MFKELELKKDPYVVELDQRGLFYIHVHIVFITLTVCDNVICLSVCEECCLQYILLYPLLQKNSWLCIFDFVLRI